MIYIHVTMCIRTNNVRVSCFAGGVSTSEIAPPGFESLAELCNNLLKLCAIEDDYKTARGILNTVHHFYRYSATFDFQIFLTKRIERAKIWQVPAYWEYAYVESLEEKMRAKQPKKELKKGKEPKVNQNAAKSGDGASLNSLEEKIDSKNPSISKDNLNLATSSAETNSERKEAAVEIASSFMMQMVDIGVPKNKVKAFLTRIVQTQKLTTAHNNTLEMLLENLTRAKEINIEEVEAAEEEELDATPKPIEKVNALNLNIANFNPLTLIREKLEKHDIDIVKPFQNITKGLGGITALITNSPETKSPKKDNKDDSTSKTSIKGEKSEMTFGGAFVTKAIGKHEGPVLSIARDGDQLVSVGGDKLAFVYDMNSFEVTHCLSGHSDAISCLLFDAEAGTVVTGSHDKTLRIWKLNRKSQFWEKKGAKYGYKAHTLYGHTSSVLCCAKAKNSSISPFITGSFDHSLRIWDMTTLKCTGVLNGHAQGVTCIKVASHSPVALSGSKDNTMRMWNIEEGRCFSVLAGHNHAINDVHIDKERIVSCSNDGTIKVNFLLHLILVLLSICFFFWSDMG
jgi:WD40 repeat protein